MPYDPPGSVIPAPSAGADLLPYRRDVGRGMIAVNRRRRVERSGAFSYGVAELSPPSTLPHNAPDAVAVARRFLAGGGRGVEDLAHPGGAEPSGRRSVSAWSRSRNAP